MPAEQVPARVRVRMYQVGFGDCFLLTFEYDKKLDDDRSERHVLIDFGTTSRAEGQTKLLPVAQLISEHSGGQLDAVVVTHRHKDHLSAFGTDEIVELLPQPSLVVRPWTEDPGAPEDPKSAPATPGPGGGLGVGSVSFLQGLRAGQDYAGTLARAINSASKKGLSGELRQMAFDQLANEDAVTQLKAWSDGGRGRYVSFGQSSGLEELIPGIRVSVLGPPTLDQHPEMARQRESDKDEFWHLYAQLVGIGDPLQLLGGKAQDGPKDVLSPRRKGAGDADLSGAAELAAAEGLDPGRARWLIDRMGRQQINSFLRIVRILDKALNNTSVILLFESGSDNKKKRLLFGGDAQIENWEYALKFADNKEDILDQLRQVDLYKVGHHGSRNATPRTLFNLWTEPDTLERPMTALLSTKAGVHGETPSTAVPRETLVNTLSKRMKLHSTEGLGHDELKGVMYIEVVADVSGAKPFEVVAPS